MKNPNPRPTKKGLDRKKHEKSEMTSTFWVKNETGQYYCEISGSSNWTASKAEAKAFRNASNLINQLKNLEIRVKVVGGFFGEYEKEVWSNII